MANIEDHQHVTADDRSATADLPDLVDATNGVETTHQKQTPRSHRLYIALALGLGFTTAVGAGIAVSRGEEIDIDHTGHQRARRIIDTNITDAWQDAATLSRRVCPQNPIQAIGSMGDSLVINRIPNPLCVPTDSPNLNVNTVAEDLDRVHTLTALALASSHTNGLSTGDIRWLAIVEQAANDYRTSAIAMKRAEPCIDAGTPVPTAPVPPQIIVRYVTRPAARPVANQPYTTVSRNPQYPHSSTGMIRLGNPNATRVNTTTATTRLHQPGDIPTLDGDALSTPFHDMGNSGMGTNH